MLFNITSCFLLSRNTPILTNINAVNSCSTCDFEGHQTFVAVVCNPGILLKSPVDLSLHYQF